MKGSVPIPSKMRRRPVDERWNLPVPAFAEHRGEVDFQAVSLRRLRDLIGSGRCAMCGELVERGVWWAIGEPKSVREGHFATEAMGHRECVEYAVLACPWLRVSAYRRMSDSREDISAVLDADKPPVWALVEGRSPVVDGTLTELTNVRVRSLFGYVDRDLRSLTLKEANELLRASGEDELKP